MTDALQELQDTTDKMSEEMDTALREKEQEVLASLGTTTEEMVMRINQLRAENEMDLAMIESLQGESAL